MLFSCKQTGIVHIFFFLTLTCMKKNNETPRFYLISRLKQQIRRDAVGYVFFL
jgi:hypothetical protein